MSGRGPPGGAIPKHSTRGGPAAMCRPPAPPRAGPRRLCPPRPPLLDQAVDAGRDGAPVGEPIARKPEGEGGVAERPFVKTHCQGKIAPRAAAPNQEAIGRRRIVDNVLALIGRAVRKRLDRESADVGL